MSDTTPAHAVHGRTHAHSSHDPMNGSGLQWSTVRNPATAWVLTLLMAMLLAGSLCFFFRPIF